MSTDRLIEAVRERPLLWDHKHPRYGNRCEMTRLWMEIAKELQTDCAFIKSRWKGLRDYYRVELRKQKGAKEGGGQSSIWPYFDRMNFLKDSMPTRITVEGTADRNWDPSSRLSERSVEIQNDAGLNQLLEVTIHETPEEERRPKRTQMTITNGRKRTISNKHPEKIETEEDDEDLLFFRSLLPEVRKFSQQNKLQLYLKIRKLISDEVLNSESDDCLS